MSKPDFRDYLKELDKETLIEMLSDAGKNWLAHDGLWFLEVEADTDMETAIRYDKGAWRRFTVVEAKRIMRRHNIPANGGLDALEKALKYRMYAYVNQQTIERKGDVLRIYMNNCRVQHARTRDGRPDFPCKPVGLVEYEFFVKTIDPNIETRCICCPPDSHPDEYWCAWEFTMKKGQGDD
ncbi:MAG: hypothetical protein DRJ08_01120 [Acidobacteria bacterium]|nr:MAG: hypothetical protein DRJ14_08055 [Acidobacteriota bacterium]RLE24308.1 MAG: hypothetical protein DRJ08_01120 [Acidobacteriota bacterium]